MQKIIFLAGDQPMTAVAIARSVNIITQSNVKTMADVQNDVPFDSDDESEGHHRSKILSKLKSWFKQPSKRHFRNEAMVVTGTEIGQLGDKQWDYVLEHKEVVFSRTTLQQKLQIVKESRKRGDVVAVTGKLCLMRTFGAQVYCQHEISRSIENMIILWSQN